MSYKICIVGDTRVGKTSYIKRLLGEKDTIDYYPTLGVEVSPIIYKNKVFNCWDCAGDEKYKGLGSNYYSGVDGFIVMFDLTNKDSYNKWINTIKKPLVIVGTHSDLEHEKIENIIEISNKKDDNLYEPFDCLLSKL